MLSWSTIVATIINPIFLMLLLLTSCVGRMRISERRFLIASALGIGFSTGLAELGKGLSIWPGHPSFPSGHETFGLATATCLLCADIRWAWIAIPLVIILGWALVDAHFHDTIDVFGALLTGPLPAWGIQRLMRPFTPKSSETRLP